MVWSLYKHQGFFGQLKLLNKQNLTYVNKYLQKNDNLIIYKIYTVVSSLDNVTIESNINRNYLQIKPNSRDEKNTKSLIVDLIITNSINSIDANRQQGFSGHQQLK